MLNIALCDDEPEQLASIGDLLLQYIDDRPGLAARLTTFSRGNSLLERVDLSGDFDLYILDIIMPGLSGIDLGIKLREKKCAGPIVYLTTSPDYAVDSYLVQAFHYLLKPVQPTRLFKVLDQAVASLEKKRTASTQVKTKNGLRLLPLDEILYVELVGRVARYYLRNGDVVNSLTIHNSFQSEMQPLLADRRFILCASSFAVNLHYVTAVGKGELTVNDQFRVPLSRGLATQVKKRWIDYWLEGCERPFHI